MQAAVRGDVAVNERAKIGGEPGRALTPEEQVTCLLDQATDPAILGRTWLGWRPFI